MLASFLTISSAIGLISGLGIRQIDKIFLPRLHLQGFLEKGKQCSTSMQELALRARTRNDSLLPSDNSLSQREFWKRHHSKKIGNNNNHKVGFYRRDQQTQR